MFACVKCGETNGLTDIFCRGCGERIDYSKVSSATTEQAKAKSRSQQVSHIEPKAVAFLVNGYFTILTLICTTLAVFLLTKFEGFFTTFLALATNTITKSQYELEISHLDEQILKFKFIILATICLIGLLGLSTQVKLFHKANAGWYWPLMPFISLPILILIYLSPQSAIIILPLFYIVNAIPGLIFIFGIIKIPIFLGILLILIPFIITPQNFWQVFGFNLFFNLFCLWKFAKAYGGGFLTSFMLLFCPITPVVIACSKRYKYQY